ncbi:syncoilin [Denticeps clupeoides]|uniref:IF rod domain-containing protein n=1 Tax=Denticeps clupeoides TaxID=299321 RepID=A0AAY4CEV5_9TELE|nr:syncoilin [Denticeps clupeoides]
MEDRKLDVVFDSACDSLTEEALQFQPLFIAEDDEEEDLFEDCVEDIQANNFSQRCRDSLASQFNGLMEKMMAKIEDYGSLVQNPSKSCLRPQSDTHNDEYLPEESSTVKIEAYEENRESEYSLTREGLGVSECKDDSFTSEDMEECVDIMDIGELGTLFEGCIEEVGRLQEQRDELVKELLELEQPMAEGVTALRTELDEARGQLVRVSLEKEALLMETHLVKKNLFIAARQCAQSQVSLRNQKQDVDSLNAIQEELKAQVQQLADEVTHLCSDHESSLKNLQSQLEYLSQGLGSACSSANLSLGRRASWDLQQYLQGAIGALEEWYEPRLVALLKWRETSMEALKKAREQAQELKTQLGPLKDEEQRLELQRICLEERIHLMEAQRKENVEQYRETLDLLEESSRELRNELQIQKNMNRDLEVLKNTVMKELEIYRKHIERQCKPGASDVEVKT